MRVFWITARKEYELVVLAESQVEAREYAIQKVDGQSPSNSKATVVNKVTAIQDCIELVAATHKEEER